MADTVTGQVVRVVADKGFGFIKAEGMDNEFFFHRSACDGCFNHLRDGARVTFLIGSGEKGPRAEQVRMVQ